MKKKCLFPMLAILLLLGGCAKPVTNSNRELTFTGSSTTLPSNHEPTISGIGEGSATDHTRMDYVLNDRHYIQADVKGGEYTQLNSFTLDSLSLSVEEALNIFAPEDASAYTVQKTEEGFRIISQAGNRCYVGPYRISFEKETESQKKINNELQYLLELYARENPDSFEQNLDFIDQASAIQMVAELLKKMGINMEPVLQTYAAMPIQKIMDYQQELLKRDQASEEKYYDPFGKSYLLENLGQMNDACLLKFTFTYQGIPIYKGSPTVSYIDGVFPPSPVTLSVLITRQGLQIFDGQALCQVGQSKHWGNIISPRAATDLYCQKYDLVIQPEANSMRVSSIYLEYIPIVVDTSIELTPYWCFPIEVDFPAGWYEVSSERFNAFTGEDITYGG